MAHMRAETDRTIPEMLVDRALLLTLYVQAARTGSVGDKLKAQKLAFLAAYPLFVKRIKAFNLEFYRYDLGPISTAIYENWSVYDELGLLPLKGNEFGAPSKIASELVDDFVAEVLARPKNRLVRDRIAKVALEFGRATTGAILDHVYGLKAATIEDPSKRPIREIPKYEHFTRVLDEGEAAAIMVVDSPWIDTLAIELIPENSRAIDRAVADLRAGRVFRGTGNGEVERDAATGLY